LLYSSLTLESHMKYIKIVSAGLLLSVIIIQPAHAYIDPGTAGLLLQAIIGGVVGALFTIRIYWQKIKTLIGFSSKTESQTALRDQTDD